MSIKKIKNILKVGINCFLETNLKTMPILLGVEPTNYCDKNCLFCLNSDMARERGYMEFSLFKKIVDQTADCVWEYAFNMVGEPTLHRDLQNMVAYAKGRGTKVTVYTNMNYQNDNKNTVEWFIKYGVDRVVVNVPSANKKMYEKIMQEGDYEVFLDNLIAINKLKKKAGNRNPILVAYYSKTSINKHRVEDDIKNLKKYFNYILVSNIHNWLGDQRISALREKGIKTDFMKKCTNLWTATTVLWDGRVAACCRDHDGRMIIGDVKKDSVYDIFNSKKIKRFRKIYRKNYLCQNCYNDRSFQFSLKNLCYQMKTNF